MNLEVIVFSSVGEMGVSQENISDVAPQLDAPDCYELVGGRRKFIVLERDDKLVLAIGPLLSGHGYYYHKEIMEALPWADKSSVRGGGDFSITIYGKGLQRRHIAKINGQSGDFGVYDYRLLSKEMREAVTEALGVYMIMFEWSR